MPRALPGCRVIPVFSLLIGVWAVAGCGDKAVPLVPVTGKVTGDGGQPLAVGTVNFQPDEAKGNTAKLAAAGMLDAGGNYKLFTGGKEGAAPGWYKVSVSPQGMPSGGMTPGGPAGSPAGDPAKGLVKAAAVNAKFQSPATSGISIEVVATPAPDAYDFKVAK